MILTEADAKTKWCPFAIASHTDPRRGFRPVDPNWGTDSKTEKEFPCLASACMAWRELHPKESREDHSGANVFMAKRAVDTHRAIRREGGPGCTGHLILDAVGFCGLAGKP